MNRRGFLTALAAAPVAAVPIAAAAKDDEYKDKYWEAQRHIDELYDQPQYFIHNDSDQDLVINPGQYVIQEQSPQTLTYFDGTGKSAEIYFDGDKLVLKNHVTGRSFSV